jgi:hypothetical protein
MPSGYPAFETVILSPGVNGTLPNVEHSLIACDSRFSAA